MASRGRPKAELVLTEEERETLSRWARRRKSAQAPALRARIVLACAEVLSNTEVAARARVAQSTVGKWQSRFVEARCDIPTWPRCPASAPMGPPGSSMTVSAANDSSIAKPL
jgi:Homeodomain-like domain